MTYDGSSDSDLSKNERREAAREKSRALREQQKKKDRRSRVILQGSLAVLVIAIVAVIGLVIVNISRPWERVTPETRQELMDRFAKDASNRVEAAAISGMVVVLLGLHRLAVQAPLVAVQGLVAVAQHLVLPEDALGQFGHGAGPVALALRAGAHAVPVGLGHDVAPVAVNDGEEDLGTGPKRAS